MVKLRALAPRVGGGFGDKMAARTSSIWPQHSR